MSHRPGMRYFPLPSTCVEVEACLLNSSYLPIALISPLLICIAAFDSTLPSSTWTIFTLYSRIELFARCAQDGVANSAVMASSENTNRNIRLGLFAEVTNQDSVC